MAETPITLDATKVFASINGQKQNSILGSSSGIGAFEAGILVYQDTSVSPNVVVPAVSNDGSAKATIAGMLLTGGVAGQPCIFVALDPALTVSSTAQLAKGSVYGLSATLGKMCLASDIVSAEYVSITGVAIDTNTIKFSPTMSNITRA